MGIIFSKVCFASRRVKLPLTDKCVGLCVGKRRSLEVGLGQLDNADDNRRNRDKKNDCYTVSW